jgi:predicted RND superfamily exporter protein
LHPRKQDISNVLRRLIGNLQDMILARPARVAILSLLLVVLALILGWQVEFRTARKDLAPQGDSEQARYERMLARLGGGGLITAVAESAGPEAGDREALQAFADDLAAAFAASPLVASTFHKVDVDWFARQALWLAPAADLETAAGALDEQGDLLAGLDGVHNLADMNLLAAGVMSDPDRRGTAPSQAEQDQAATGLATLTSALEQEREFLADPDRAVARLDGYTALTSLVAASVPDRGYLASYDGSLLFILITPDSDDESLPVLRTLLADLRQRAAETIQRHPGFKAAFTGESATTVDEMDSVRRDTWRTGAVAATGVTLLTLVVFRWKRNALIVMLALAAGVAWSFGAVFVELGYLNVITSAFLSTLVGVGVAYGIHPVSEYEMEQGHCKDPVAAVRAAYYRTGTGVTVSAVTTSVAFFSILLMRFRGFAELGLVAGVGVLFCLLAALTTLPALLVLDGRRRHRLESASGRTPEQRATAVDRWWMERGAGRITRFPRTTTLAAVALTAVAGWAARDIGFDINMLDLLPDDAESLQYQRRMILESDLSPFFNMATAADLASLRSMAAAASAEPDIGTFDSILPLLPDRKADAARRTVAGHILDLTVPEQAAPLTADLMTTSLSRLETALANAAEDAFAAGIMTLALPLEEARAAAAAARDTAAGADGEQVAAWNRGQQGLLSWARENLADLQEAAAQPVPTLDDLPREIHRRYLTDDGHFLAYMQPVASVFDADYLDAYVAASKRVDREVTGFPVVFRRMSQRITHGFRRAVIGGGFLVMIVLLIDTRSLRDTALAALPLAMGVTWMLGAMRVLGLSYNFANLVAVPLIIGVGIDNGVHIIHRWKLEGDLGMHVILRRTVRAILIASLTTMVGFGSLALASHRGMAGLGLLLLLGVGACLVTSTLVLPNLLLALGLVRR